jgi:hypothetical protein
MKAYDARGGVMYSLFQNTRYACREIAYWDWLDENVSPYRTLSGDEAVDLLSQMLIRQAAQGGAQ